MHQMLSHATKQISAVIVLKDMLGCIIIVHLAQSRDGRITELCRLVWTLTMPCILFIDSLLLAIIMLCPGIRRGFLHEAHRFSFPSAALLVDEAIHVQDTDLNDSQDKA